MRNPLQIDLTMGETFCLDIDQRPDISVGPECAFSVPRLFGVRLHGHVEKYLLIFENNFMGRYFERLMQDYYVPKPSLIAIMILS